MTAHSPILVLDSGLGGLTVVRAIRALLPSEELVYFGDTARLPYGSKTAQTVSEFVKQIIHYLLPLNPKHVVIACNTATALALRAVRAEFPQLSISGVIEPGAKAAVIAAGAKRSPVIGVLATEATVRSKSYQHAVLRRRNLARIVLQAAPLLVPIIEEGRGGHDPLVQLALEQYLAPLKQCGLDVLILGCTHYPIFRSLIKRVMGTSVSVIDSAEQCSHDIARRLQAIRPHRRRESIGFADRLNFSEASDLGSYRASLRCIVTDDPDRFERLAPRFLGEPISAPEWISPDRLYGPSQIPYPQPELRAAV